MPSILAMEVTGKPQVFQQAKLTREGAYVLDGCLEPHLELEGGVGDAVKGGAGRSQEGQIRNLTITPSITRN